MNDHTHLFQTPEHITDDVLRSLADPALIAPHLEVRLLRRQKDDKNRGQVVGYIQKEAVAAIADRLIGPANWSFQIINQGNTGRVYTATGRLTVRTAYGEIIRTDAGTNVLTQGEESEIPKAYKGAISDAFKRCWQQLGIGRVIGSLPMPWVNLDNEKVTDKVAEPVIRQWRTYIQRIGGAPPAGSHAHDATEPPAEETAEQKEAVNRYHRIVELFATEDDAKAFLRSRDIDRLGMLLDSPLFTALCEEARKVAAETNTAPPAPQENA